MRFIGEGDVIMDSGCGGTLGGRGRRLAVGGYVITNFIQPSL